MAAVLASAAPARAQSAIDSATAETLFNEALALLEKQQPAEACPKLEESQRLDPGVGTLLYLADCYRQLGRTASAWATFRDAAYLAKDKNDEREETAIEFARELEPKLSYLTIRVAPEAGPTVEVTHDGKPIGPALWGTAFPVDPGEHTVVARAPGKEPWTGRVTIAGDAQRQELVIPPLADVAPAPPPPVLAPQAAPAVARSSASTQTTVGWVLLGTGSAAVVTGGILALLARSDNSDAAAECRPDVVNLCNPAGVELGESAQAKATFSGISTGLGLLAIGGGATLLLMTSGNEAPASPPPAPGVSPPIAGSGSTPAVALEARVSAHAGGVTLSGRW